MINSFLIILFSISISGSILFSFVLLLDKIFCSYAVYWQSIIIKLLFLYFLLPSVFIPAIFLSRHQIEVEYVNGEDIKMWITQIEGTSNIMEKRWNGFSLFLLGIWIMGFCFIFIKRLIHDTKILQQLELLSMREEEQEIEGIKNYVRKELNIQRNIDIYKTNLVDSLCLCGIIKPKLFFPEIRFSEQEMIFLLKHELYHYKRKDVLYNMLISLFLGIHWFNPIIWIFIVYLHNFTEISCDQCVLKDCTKELREIYAQLLIRISTGMKRRELYGVTDFKVQSEKFINRRLYNIMKQKKYSKRRIAIGVLCSVMLCPTVTYASTITVTKTYDKILKYVPYNEALGFYKISEEKMPKELPKQKIIRTDETLFTINPKEVNYIDFKILANQGKETNVYIKKGQKVVLTATGDYNSDKFKVVLSLNGKEKKVVKSNEGTVIINDFQASESGTYKILIKNLMTSKTINIIGSIKIIN